VSSVLIYHANNEMDKKLAVDHLHFQKNA